MRRKPNFLKAAIPVATRAKLRDSLNLLIQKLHRLRAEVFHRHKISRVQGNQLLLNIGCGKNIYPDWINIDAWLQKGVYYADLRRKIPLKDHCAKHIHSEHFLEHLEYEEAHRFLAECNRLLEPNGTFRIIVPDAEKYLRSYCEDNHEFFDKLKHLGGRVEPFKTKVEIINMMFRMSGFHRFAWDYETLALALKNAGFNDITKSEVGGISEDLNIDGTDEWRLLESVYINARK